MCLTDACFNVKVKCSGRKLCHSLDVQVLKCKFLYSVELCHLFQITLSMTCYRLYAARHDDMMDPDINDKNFNWYDGRDECGLASIYSLCIMF